MADLRKNPARVLDLAGRPLQGVRLSRHSRDVALAHALLRLVLGVNLAMHGLARLLGGLGHFLTELDHRFAGTALPLPLVNAFGAVLPFVEAGVGVLLVLGLFSRGAIVAGMAALAGLGFGSGWLQDYPALAMQLLYAAVYAWLLASSTHDLYSVDSWLARRGRR